MDKRDKLMVEAINAAIAAGGEIMIVYNDPRQDFGIELKADNSPLTKADRRADRCIATALEPIGIRTLSEESAHAPYEERRQWQSLWIIDPLDGTKEFIKRNGEFTVNIALVDGGHPVLGVVYAPATGELFWGIVGEGAGKATVQPGARHYCTMDEVRQESMPLPLASDDRPLTVVASRSHLNADTEAFISRLREEHGEAATLSRGSSLKFCMLAEGKADVYPRFAPTMEWDTAAGQAVAEAAGCTVERADGSGRLTYNKSDLHNPWFVVSREGTRQQ